MQYNSKKTYSRNFYENYKANNNNTIREKFTNTLFQIWYYSSNLFSFRSFLKHAL